jgi:hypothetical protein
MSAPLRLCLLALLPLLATSCGKKAGPAEAAKLFFGLIANGRSSEAYESTALGFKAQQSEKRFAQANKELGLVNVRSLTNEPPKIEGNTATLKMEITDNEGAKAPLNVTLVDERGAWRVFSVRAPRSVETGLAANLLGTVGRGSGFTDGVNHPRPSDAEIRQLVETTLLLFDESVTAGNFDRFYDEISEAWQEQVTKAKMKRAFQGFIDGKISVAHLRGQPAIFYEPPAVSTEGLLTARGYYAGDPHNVVFGMKFMYETPKWRLFGLDVSLARALPTAEKDGGTK